VTAQCTPVSTSQLWEPPATCHQNLATGSLGFRLVRVSVVTAALDTAVAGTGWMVVGSVAGIGLWVVGQGMRAETGWVVGRGMEGAVGQAELVAVVGIVPGFAEAGPGLAQIEVTAVVVLGYWETAEAVDPVEPAEAVPVQPEATAAVQALV
jgi:hypothetical protein